MGKLEDLAARLVNERSGLGTLGFASFLESTVVPIPFEMVMAPLMAAHPGRSWVIATVILIGSLIGALLFYLLAFWFFEPVVAPALEALGLSESFQSMRERLSKSDFFWAVFIVSLSPVPFQLATLGAGAVGGSPWMFMAAVASSRAIRYYVLALLAALFGARIVRAFGSKRAVLLGGVAVLIDVYVAVSIFFRGGGEAGFEARKP